MSSIETMHRDFMIQTSPPSGLQMDYSRAVQEKKKRTDMIKYVFFFCFGKVKSRNTLRFYTYTKRGKSKYNRLRQVTDSEHNLVWCKNDLETVMAKLQHCILETFIFQRNQTETTCGEFIK